jgi:Concanavalin A-like lectin/glucanases superfamily
VARGFDGVAGTRLSDPTASASLQLANNFSYGGWAFLDPTQPIEPCTIFDAYTSYYFEYNDSIIDLKMGKQIGTDSWTSGIDYQINIENAWHHLLGVHRSSGNGQEFYLDGASAETGTSIVSNFYQYGGVALGAQPGGNREFKGRVAEWAVWDVVLTVAEIQSLAKGFSPLLVRPSALVYYAPASGGQSPEPDLVGGNSHVLNGNVTNAPGPRLIGRR